MFTTFTLDERKQFLDSIQEIKKKELNNFKTIRVLLKLPFLQTQDRYQKVEEGTPQSHEGC